ncbi:MAG: acetylglutamate kinase [Acidobacteriota bacterium]
MIQRNDTPGRAEGLRRALPYIRLYKGKTFVVKVGGDGCVPGDGLGRVLEQVGVLAELGIRVVLVHGGGPQTTELSRKLGIEPTIVDGRRVTCDRTLDVAVMTLCGSVNSAVLAACRGAGIRAAGVSGLDASLVTAARRAPVPRFAESGTSLVDYGHVGDIEAVDPSVLRLLLDAGIVPVVSPISCDREGAVLNVNGDTVASRIAIALCAEKLIFLTGAPGILEDRADPQSLVSYTDLDGLRDLTSRGAIAAGMLPKARAAREAIEGGVPRVHVISRSAADALLVEVFTNEGCGTLVVRDASEIAAVVA